MPVNVPPNKIFSVFPWPASPKLMGTTVVQRTGIVQKSQLSIIHEEQPTFNRLDLIGD